MTKLQEAIDNHDVVITGEGRIDNQTGYGKVVASVAAMVDHAKGKRLIGVAGLVEGSKENVRKHYGMEKLFSVREYAKNDEDSIRNVATYLKLIGRQVLLTSTPNDTP